jgi:hypothetical protein
MEKAILRYNILVIIGYSTSAWSGYQDLPESAEWLASKDHLRTLQISIDSHYQWPDTRDFLEKWKRPQHLEALCFRIPGRGLREGWVEEYLEVPKTVDYVITDHSIARVGDWNLLEVLGQRLLVRNTTNDSLTDIRSRLHHLNGAGLALDLEKLYHPRRDPDEALQWIYELWGHVRVVYLNGLHGARLNLQHLAKYAEALGMLRDVPVVLQSRTHPSLERVLLGLT